MIQPVQLGGAHDNGVLKKAGNDRKPAESILQLREEFMKGKEQKDED